jgi:hypothetical protein
VIVKQNSLLVFWLSNNGLNKGICQASF